MKNLFWIFLVCAACYEQPESRDAYTVLCYTSDGHEIYNIRTSHYLVLSRVEQDKTGSGIWIWVVEDKNAGTFSTISDAPWPNANRGDVNCYWTQQAGGWHSR